MRHVPQSLDLKSRQTLKHGLTESEQEENDFMFLDWHKMQAEVLNKLFALNHLLSATQYLRGQGGLLNICSDKILSQL